MLEDYRGTHLDFDSLNIVDLPQGAILIAYIKGSRPITPLEVRRFEKAIQERLGDKEVRLLIRSDDLTDVSGKGRVLYGRAHFGRLSEEDVKVQDELEREVKNEISRFKDMFAPNVDAEKRGGKWHLLAEVVGPRILRPSEVALVQKKTSQSIGQEISLRVWSRVELMVTEEDFVSVEGFIKQEVEKRGKKGRVAGRK
jgi:hypothetical protein